ncbi:MAG TPA: argininosuccinate lyase [Candidatus Polarisedimenticolia bacterium]|jgi:argininosuccinate lyase
MTTERLWGGGFSEPTHPALVALSLSLIQDLPLADADLRASAAYARALGRAGVLKEEEVTRLIAALHEMRGDLATGRWAPAGAEDIHAAIEAEVIRRAGEAGRRLHTGRSRNDQVVTAFRMTVIERADGILSGVRALQRGLVTRAEAEIDTLLPAYTHLQRAQPVRLAHWLMAHFWPLERDAGRLADARGRASVLPLGSGAATGNPFGIDRAWLAAQLGFREVSDNSLDAVGDRDFAAELAFACALLSVHLSRLAEDLSIWSTTEFGFVRWPDALATGSSLMPNKRNPDLIELVRGRAAAAIGDVTALLSLLKGLATGYQRDLQEDKPPVWRITGATLAGLEAMTAAILGIEFNRERMRGALSDDLLATEVADRLVARGLSFREAHAAVGEAVTEARRRRVGLLDLSGIEGARLPGPLRTEDLSGLGFEAAVERRSATGGTARAAVLAQMDRARAILEAP